ncbi:hypothetical protein LCGC14_2027130, partial [marine sediment metagenome]
MTDTNYPALHAPEPGSSAASAPAAQSVERGVRPNTSDDCSVLYVLNKDCPFCERVLTKSVAPIVLLPCGHAYHVSDRCGGGFLARPPGKQCTACKKVGRRAPARRPSRRFADEEYDDDDDGGGGGSSDENAGAAFDDDDEGEYDCEEGAAAAADDDEDKAALEEYYRRVYRHCVLSRSQKRALTASWKEAFKLNDREIDIHLLLNNGVDMEKLFDAGIGLLDQYFLLNVKNWDNLRDLGLRKDHLFYTMDKKGHQPFLPLGTLQRLYGVTYKNLVDDLMMTLADFGKWRLTPAGMRGLGCTVDKLLADGMTKKSMPCLDYSLLQWRALGLHKRQLFQLDMGPSDFRDLNWNPTQIAQVMGLNAQEQQAFGIVQLHRDMLAVVPKSRPAKPAEPSDARRRRTVVPVAAAIIGGRTRAAAPVARSVVGAGRALAMPMPRALRQPVGTRPPRPRGHSGFLSARARALHTTW